VELDIIYKYHAPDERPRDATTIPTDTMDVEDSEIWTNLHNLHPVGHVISLPTDDPDEYGGSRKSTWSLRDVPCRPRSRIPAS
jgi:hypothetical protein